MDEWKSVYFRLSVWHSFWWDLPKLYMNNFSKKSLKIKKKGHTQANYDEAIQIFYFLLFISPFNGFLFKGSCSSKSILFIYSYFYRGKYCTTFFFSSQNNIWRNIIYTHYYSLYYDHLFPMPSSGDNSWSVCQLVGRTYSLNINQWVALTDLFTSTVSELCHGLLKN